MKSAWIVLGMVTACGRTGSQGGVADNMNPPPGAASGAGTLCPSAGWSSPTQPVAVGFSGADLVIVSADGSQHVVRTLSHAGTSIRSSGDDIVAWAEFRETGDPNLSNGETVLLDRAGNVVWQLPGLVEQRWAVVATRAGMVAYAEGKTHLVQANGNISSFPFAGYSTADFVGKPRADAWLTAFWSFDIPTKEREWHYGFVNLDGRPAQELRFTPVIEQDLRDYQGEAYYLSDPSSLTLNVETPALVRSMPVGTVAAAKDIFSFLKTASHVVVFVVVAGNHRPIRIVDLATGDVRSIDGDALNAIVASSNGVPRSFMMRTAAESDFLLGEENYEKPLFLLDTRSGALEPVRLDLLAPLALTDSPYCGSSDVMVDGRIGVGLRTASEAGFYLGHANGTGWQRIGLPYRDVTAIRAERVAETWVVTGVSGIDSYCTPFLPFTAPAAGAPSALQGDVIQIVTPGGPPLVLPEPSPYVTLDAAGLCALAVFPATAPALPETRVYDVLSGTSTALQGLTNVVWF